MSDKEFVPHKNVPGPERLHMEKADNSGAVNTNPEFIADRLAIINHVSAYSYLIDEGRWDEWLALFADDVLFENTSPDLGTIRIKGKEGFKALVDERYIKPGKNSKAVRRHTMGNLHVTEQTATTAKVRTYMLISNVPQADTLKPLTSGTYNAVLEKRNNKWTITRWYIEVDAKLSPSKIPEGFGDAVQWTPDPLTVIPGAVAGPIPGQISLKNHAFSMPAGGPLYKNAPQWSWKDLDIVIVDYLTDAKSAAAFLPENVTTVPIPELPGFSPVKQVWAHYRDSSFGPYHELIVGIPCLYKGEMYIYVPFIYVDRDSAMSSGREIGGWPKKLADIRMDRFGNDFRLSLTRGSAEIHATARIGHKIFSTPLPANDAVPLAYPQNMTLPLPPPTGKPQDSVPLPTLTFKYVPGVGAENAAPAVAQLIGAPWKVTGNFHGTEGVAVVLRSSEEDPFGKLPVLATVGGTYISGEMTLALKEMKVLEDFLAGRLAKAA
ncbi:MAG TPA: acetoacetate decarboxylase family protein [Oligoflexus sp.]|uniref:acetoacetate decarboxylase family protein n=1 Tax=Oligoflexus sp. TaxID=1971216 RepID=UPI002D49BE20|nr:acetoacetate decarboxylase family protein [Oligoflexus sp.]HYX37758.1 acetoacetate decarboxylase family protein [Oligoflexus sp.]